MVLELRAQAVFCSEGHQVPELAHSQKVTEPILVHPNVDFGRPAVCRVPCTGSDSFRVRTTLDVDMSHRFPVPPKERTSGVSQSPLERTRRDEICDFKEGKTRQLMLSGCVADLCMG